jgi:hypothetical protein
MRQEGNRFVHELPDRPLVLPVCGVPGCLDRSIPHDCYVDGCNRLIPLREVESVIVPNTGKILRLVFSATEIWPSLYSVRDISVQEEIVLGVMRVVARA